MKYGLLSSSISLIFNKNIRGLLSYFSDKDYLSETNKFLSNLVKNNVEIIYFNSQPSIVPSLYFDEKIDYKYLNTNTLISESIITDTSSDKKIKVVYSISDELSELLIKNEFIKLISIFESSN